MNQPEFRQHRSFRRFQLSRQFLYRFGDQRVAFKKIVAARGILAAHGQLQQALAMLGEDRIQPRGVTVRIDDTQ